MSLDELSVKRTERAWNEAASEKDLFIACAKNFGWFFGDALKKGFTPEQSFAMARAHFRTYGKAMFEFAEIVNIEMIQSYQTCPRNLERV